MRRFFSVLLGVVFSGLALAPIDSAGGVANLGGETNHSSIGVPYATGDSASGLIAAHDLDRGNGSIVEWNYSLNQSPRYFPRVEILIPTN